MKLSGARNAGASLARGGSGVNAGRGARGGCSVRRLGGSLSLVRQAQRLPGPNARAGHRRQSGAGGHRERDGARGARAASSILPRDTSRRSRGGRSRVRAALCWRDALLRVGGVGWGGWRGGGRHWGRVGSGGQGRALCFAPRSRPLRLLQQWKRRADACPPRQLRAGNWRASAARGLVPHTASSTSTMLRARLGALSKGHRADPERGTGCGLVRSGAGASTRCLWQGADGSREANYQRPATGQRRAFEDTEVGGEVLAALLRCAAASWRLGVGWLAGRWGRWGRAGSAD